MKCPKCGCEMAKFRDIKGEYWYCTNRGQYGGGACGQIKRK